MTSWRKTGRPPRHRIGMLLAVLVLLGAGWLAAAPAPPASPLDSLDQEATPTENELPFGTGTSYLLGTTLMQQGDYQGALPYLDHAYRMASGEREIAEAYLNVLLGLAYGERALEVLGDMVRHWPADLDIRRRRIALLGDLRRYDEALAEIARVRQAGLPDDELLVMEGNLLGNAGRVPEALVTFRRALVQIPEESERIYLLMAAMLERENRSDTLLALWEEAVGALPGSRTLRYGLLRQLVRSNKLDRALVVAQEADRAAPDALPDTSTGGSAAKHRFSWKLELVDLLVQAGRSQQAIQILESQRASGTLGLDGELWLARLLASGDRWPEAHRSLEELARQHPNAPEVFRLLGELLAAQEEPAAAEEALRKALSLAPEEADSYVALVRLLILRHEGKLGVPDQEGGAGGIRSEIEDLAVRGAALLPEDDHRGQMILGYAFRSLGEPQRALPLFSAATEAQGLRKEALLQLAIAQDEADHDDEARGTLETLWRENPGDANAANSLGYFLADRGEELERAVALIRQALAAEPRNGAFLDSLGWALFRQGRPAEALDQLILATNALPDDPTILEHLGLTLHALGQAEEALRVLQRARALGANSAELRSVLAELEDETAPR
jgi:tetratricopeptide (TPR) repeat protein